MRRGFGGGARRGGGGGGLYGNFVSANDGTENKAYRFVDAQQNLAKIPNRSFQIEDFETSLTRFLLTEPKLKKLNISSIY